MGLWPSYRANGSLRRYRPQRVIARREVLSVMRRHWPGLVPLDLGLPDVDGQALIGRIREISPVPIVVLSSRRDESAKVAGADDFVTKPFGAVVSNLNLEELRAVPGGRHAAPCVDQAPEPSVPCRQRIRSTAGAPLDSSQ
jgi:two-component system KDP operon response regulator KdpE